MRAVITLLLLSSLLFFFQLGSFSLYDAAETTYGEIIKQIRLTGDWITMHYNGEILFDKPPLYFWLATLATYVFGFNEFAVRFWAAVCGVLTVVTTYHLGKSFYNERVGFLAGIIAMTSFQFLIQSRIAEIDILLTLLMTASFLFFWHRRYLPMYICLALGTITKGIIGIALPVFAIFLFLLSKKELNRIKEMRIPLGIIMVLLIAGPWYITEWLLHGEKFTRFILGFLFLSRFQGVVSGHPGPWYYYFLAIILGFAPWSHFLPYALFKTFKSSRLNTKDFTLKTPELLTLCYIIPVFIVFSIAQTKLPNYMLPIYPFLAIMVGKLWDEATNGKPATKPSGRGRRGFLISQFLLLIIVCLLVIGVTIAGRQYISAYQEMTPNLLFLGGILLAGSLCSVLCALCSRFSLSFLSLPAMVFLIAFVLTTQTLPAVEKFKGEKELGQQVAKAIKPNEQIAAYNIGNRPGVVFYNVRPIVFITDKKEAVNFLLKKKGYCFTLISESLSGKVFARQGDLIVLH